MTNSRQITHNVAMSIEAHHTHRRTVGILLFDDVEILDFAGPFEVFAVTDELQQYQVFDVFTCALNTNLIRGKNGLSIQPDYRLDDMPLADILVIPGGSGIRALLKIPAVLQWLRHANAQAECVLSICSGALLLAKTRLLDDLQATTHHEVIAELAALAPRTTIHQNRRFIDNGKIITSAGISAGIDASLHVVTCLLGEQVTATTREYMEYAP